MLQYSHETGETGETPVEDGGDEMSLADREDLAQEIALAQLEAELGRRLARAAATKWRKMTQSCLLAGASVAAHQGIALTPDGRPEGSQWERVEQALLYAPLSCPICGAFGEWVDDGYVPRGAIFVDHHDVQRRHNDDAWWEHYRGPRHGIGYWVCHGRQMHATRRPATRSRHAG